MKIGVITSGGDAPGMNAAIRSIVRYAIPRGMEVYGIERGYQGLIEGELVPLSLRSVGNILHLGGTILKTSRSKEFMTEEGLDRGALIIEEKKIDALIVIGGEGSFKGASELIKKTGLSVIGIPATIDNDVSGTDTTIGFDTAVNTAINAIDKIRDTVLSLERIFVVEVMGRNRGFLALDVGLAGGAGIILIPEIEYNLDQVCKKLKVYQEIRKATIIVAAEGIGDTLTVVNYIEKNTEFEVRRSVLGYIQRGGSPTARSRILANLFGTMAVDLILCGEKNKMVGIKGNELVSVPLEYSWKVKKPIDVRLYRLAEELAI